MCWWQCQVTELGQVGGRAGSGEEWGQTWFLRGWGHSGPGWESVPCTRLVFFGLSLWVAITAAVVGVSRVFAPGSSLSSSVLCPFKGHSFLITVFSPQLEKLPSLCIPDFQFIIWKRTVCRARFGLWHYTRVALNLTDLDNYACECGVCVLSPGVWQWEALPRDGVGTGGGEAAVTVKVGSEVCLN